jgi:hypothetical protein
MFWGKNPKSNGSKVTKEIGTYFDLSLEYYELSPQA